MYVRREIRALSDADLNTFLDAAYKMWDMDLEEGRSIFGENYKTNAYLVEFHHFNAAWQDADHIHEV